MLDRLEPRKIVIASSAPQIRFPDCYGIDMSRMKDFVAFRAVVALLEEEGLDYLLEEVYEKCLTKGLKAGSRNYVKDLYDHFSYNQVSRKIAEISKPTDLRAELEVVYQTIEGLHASCPNHLGDWYFTGNYPTVGGSRVVNQAYINYMQGKGVRAY
jgi:amidophosphoribosyltransferase